MEYQVDFDSSENRSRFDSLINQHDSGFPVSKDDLIFMTAMAEAHAIKQINLAQERELEIFYAVLAKHDEEARQQERQLDNTLFNNATTNICACVKKMSPHVSRIQDMISYPVIMSVITVPANVDMFNESISVVATHIRDMEICLATIRQIDVREINRGFNAPGSDITRAATNTIQKTLIVIQNAKSAIEAARIEINGNHADIMTIINQLFFN